MKLRRITAGITAAMCCAGMLSVMPYGGVQTFAAEAVYNNFEVDYEGWHGTSYDVVMTAENGKGYESSRGMTVSGRLTAEDGATSAKGFYMFGDVEYTYNMKVYSEQDETFRLNLLCINEKTGEETVVELDSVDAKAGEWTDLSAVYTAPANSYEFRLTLTTDSTSDFTFDEVKITTLEKKAVDAVYAASADQGLKDAFANYFRVGNILNGYTVGNSGITAMIIKNYNSLECENETKPDATLVRNGSTNTDIKVTLNGAASIIDFCIKNNIPLRGHALVWHSQTPQWFFKDNFQDGGNWVNSATMDQRLESYIKNLFALFKSQYPSLNLYAYDVCNEVVSDDANRTKNNGGARMPGYGNGQSPWVQVYGSNAFVEKAFTFARKYAPEGCSLFYNDYNEYWDHKRDCIYNMCKDLYQKGILDGVGMQSHVNADVNGFSGAQAHKTAMQKYASIGCEVQVTELDVSCENGKFSAQQQADKYKALFQAAIDTNNGNFGGKVTAMCIWGPNDSNTWIGGENKPLLHDGGNQPKTAYNALMAMVPESDWGDPKNPAGSTPAAPVEPDANGWYYHSTFEGNLDSWAGRGSATVQTSGAAAYKGSEALLVQNREAAWNGATRTLNTRAFKPGEEYSFSATAMYKDGGASDTFYMKLQYTDASGETMYDTIAESSAVKGEWVQLANTNYKIPAGASNMQVYVETAESTNNFYVDEAIGAVAGTKVEGPGPGAKLIKGDVDFSGTITAFDLAAAKKGLARKFSKEITSIAADVDENGTVEVVDVVQLAKFVMGKINEFTVAEKPTEPEPEKPAFNYNANLQYKEAPGKYLEPCSQAGRVINETYNGINGTNKLNVYLPYGYDANKQYNIFYLMHGGGENENTIFSNDVKLHHMLDHMIMNGELEPLIVVTPTFNKCAADTFYKELRASVIPFVEGKYSTYAKSTSEADIIASRMHRAYGGFSMGSLSTWCVGNYALDLVGYLMPLSGDNWKGVSALTSEIDRLGYKKDQYFIMCATGSKDIAYGNMNPQMEAMKKDTAHFTYTSDFSKGNFYYLVAPEKTHWWGFVRHYIYDGLPYFFHE